MAACPIRPHANGSACLMDALIGSNGYVGSWLDRGHQFGARFNSRTTDDAFAQSFGTVVCAAAPGSMFEANRMPERDSARIDRLIAQLGKMSAQHFVLISTSAVLERFSAHDETMAVFTSAAPYGLHRRRLEIFVQGHFASSMIIRLPALFGEGLKKNFLFDILNPVPSIATSALFARIQAALPNGLRKVAEACYRWEDGLAAFILDRELLLGSKQQAEIQAALCAAGIAAVTFTNPASSFQFYNLARLWPDIRIGLAAGLATVHLAPEPVTAREVHAAVTRAPMPESEAGIHIEDMRTQHAALWGRSGSYIVDRTAVMADIEAFMAKNS